MLGQGTERVKMIEAILFDKDGTLLDFDATWGNWAYGFLSELAEGDDARFRAMAEGIEYIPEERRFHPTSPVIAGTSEDWADGVLPHLPNWDRDQLIAFGNSSSSKAPLAAVFPLEAYLQGLRSRNLILGVATNDSEASARQQLTRLGVLTQFDRVIGYDSGYGAKPAPGMCNGFATEMEIDPARILMVGDSTHDLHAGRAAGMITVAVLTGPAREADLAPHADHVFPDISHLERLL